MQQELTRPGVIKKYLLSKYLLSTKSLEAKKTFGTIFPLEDVGRVRELFKGNEWKDWILKPNLEGGENCVFGDEIPRFLEGIREEEMASYILMEKFKAPVNTGFLMGAEGVYEGPQYLNLGFWAFVCGDMMAVSWR